MMPAQCTIIALLALLAPTICAPEAREKSGIPNNEVSNNKNVPVPSLAIPADLSYEELIYIIQSRSGDERRAPKVLSPCARAILGCCKGSVMNETCSETLACGAFFFDVNPCEDRFILDALRAARTFYEQFNSVTT